MPVNSGHLVVPNTRPQGRDLYIVEYTAFPNRRCLLPLFFSFITSYLLLLLPFNTYMATSLNSLNKLIVKWWVFASCINWLLQAFRYLRPLLNARALMRTCGPPVCNRMYTPSFVTASVGQPGSYVWFYFSEPLLPLVLLFRSSSVIFSILFTCLPHSRFSIVFVCLSLCFNSGTLVGVSLYLHASSPSTRIAIWFRFSSRTPRCLPYFSGHGVPVWPDLISSNVMTFWVLSLLRMSLGSGTIRSCRSFLFSGRSIFVWIFLSPFSSFSAPCLPSAIVSSAYRTANSPVAV